MSVGREELEDMEIEYRLFMAEEYGRIERGIWKMRDGKTIAVEDMETSHIKKCIRMLERKQNDELASAWIRKFNSVLLMREMK